MDNILIKKTHVESLLRMYFCQKDGHCILTQEAEEELAQLLNDLPTYNLKAVGQKLEEKRYWDAARILKKGWENEQTD